MDKTFYSIPIETLFSTLSSSSSEEDLRINSLNRSPELLNKRLHELVPLLKFIDFRLEQVTDHETTGGAPLLSSTMNQNGTHQAAVFYLMADYIAGIALYAALPGTYIVGLHDRSPCQPIQLWTKSVSVNHKKPGIGYIQGQATVSETQSLEVRKTLLQKGNCDVTLNVVFTQDNEEIADASISIGVYFDNPIIPSKKLDFFQREDAKLSAKLIAGLRRDDYSQKLAGEQGKALAERFTQFTPQLPDLVFARSLHVNDYLKSEGKNYEQVVDLGIGLDPKPIWHASPDQKWFGIDLYYMCKYRKEAFEKNNLESNHLTLVSSDLFNQDWGNAIEKEGYDRCKPTLFIMEGISMYLQRDELIALADFIQSLNSNPDSVLWVDHVTPTVFEMEFKEIQSFLSEISRLGEPFITGFSNVESFSDKLKTVSQSAASDVLGVEAIHPIFKNYIFSILKINSV